MIGRHRPAAMASNTRATHFSVFQTTGRLPLNLKTHSIR